MHKDFYASGFLYHLRTQQILLQQPSAENESEWTMFSCWVNSNETAEDAFKRLIHDILKLELKEKAISPVYKYFDERIKKDHHITYARITKLEKFPSNSNTIFCWFNFKQIQKLNISPQTKHNLIVAQRVIDSALRKKLGQQTIE
jgi:ADP-ribose pyrophosphatase YjhB (NUDIX family)